MADDRELMARVQEGEQSALEILFARWESPLFAFFYRLGCPPAAVEELVEEVLVALYRQRRRYDPTRPLAPWMFGIARLVWRDHLRHRRREAGAAVPLESVGGLEAAGPSPLETSAVREGVDAVRLALAGLPDEQQEAFILRHYHGLSYEELAQALAAPVGTAKWRVHEALRRLGAALGVAREGRQA